MIDFEQVPMGRDAANQARNDDVADVLEYLGHASVEFETGIHRAKHIASFRKAMRRRGLRVSIKAAPDLSKTKHRVKVLYEP